MSLVVTTMSSSTQRPLGKACRDDGSMTMLGLTIVMARLRESSAVRSPCHCVFTPSVTLMDAV